MFRAMNARGQRETAGALGDFCIKCHAPMAYSTGASTDGTNLDALPQPLHGVTCYFCHSVENVTDTHNDPLVLATDNVMRGEISDPVSTQRPHGAAQSDFLDGEISTSANTCGACHDIVSPHGAAIERTFAEWQASAFSTPPSGLTCAECHMSSSTSMQAIAEVPGAPLRTEHSHAFPAVDSALIDFPNAAVQQQLIQAFLNTTLQSAVCMEIGSRVTVQVILDNVAAGHSWPSGSAQDRRAWVELTAFDADGGLIYASGAVDAGEPPTQTGDPYMWMMRDCIFDADGGPVDMFWQAASYDGNELPALATFNPMDPRFYQTHFLQTYPGTSEHPFEQVPARIEMSVFLQPIGLDVLDDLIASGDLDAGFRSAMPTLQVGTTVVWTAATVNGSYVDTVTGAEVNCVTNSNLNVQANTVPALMHSRCYP